MVARAAARQGLAHAPGEERPVGEVGQRVVFGAVLELGLEPDALGDVPAVEDESALVAVDGGLHVQPLAAARLEAAFDAGGGLLGGGCGEEAAYLVDHPAEVVGVDQGGQLGADQLLRLAAVHPGGGRAHVAQGPGGCGDHDDVAGALDEGAEVVLLLGQFLGQGDVVEEHDALPDDEGEHDGAACEHDHPVDLPAVHDVVEDAEGAHGGREVRREGGQGSGDRTAVRPVPARVPGRHRTLVDAPGAPGGVREQQRAGEPAGVEQLSGLVLGAQQG